MMDDVLVWRTVRYTLDVQVIADNDEDALYFANLALPDYTLTDANAEVVEVNGDVQ